MSKAAQFHHDIQVEILSRLPVKSILRFKCVCKQWLSLFSDRRFISLHRKNTLMNPKNCSLLVDQEYTTILINFHCMKKPIKILSSKLEQLVGICNGIACFTYSSLGWTYINLYNPAMKLYKDTAYKDPLSLKSGIFSPPWPRVVIGFGLGLNEDEFIIIRISFTREETRLPGEEQAAVHLYSTMSDSWKKIEMDFRFHIRRNCSIVRKGIPYWLAFVQGLEEEKDGFLQVLLWYDLENEVFKHARLPKFNCDYKKLSTRIAELKDNLALLVCSISGDDEESSKPSCIDVWIFDHNEECFSKKYSCGPIMVEVERLKGCLPSGEILFNKKGTFDLFLFDPVTQENRYVYTYEWESLYTKFWSHEVLNYTESLITIDGMKQYQE